MELITLKEDEFRKYALKHTQNNFHQTIEWGLLKKKNGWKMNLLGLVDNKSIKAACLLLEKKTPFGNIFYSPRGFLIDYHNKTLLETFTEKIKQYTKDNKGIFIKIDPYVQYKERDINGDIKKNGKNNEIVVQNLINLGYVHNGFNLYFENLQPRWMFTKNLENKSLDELMSEMESKTRQLIRKNIKRNLITEELNDGNLEEFKKITTHTSERRNFIDRPFSYYKDMYDVLSKNNMIKFIITKLDTVSYLESLENEKEIEKKNILDKEKKIKDKTKINIEKTNRSIETSKINIKHLNKNIDNIKSIKNKYGNEIILSGILFIIYGDEVLSLFGGSYEEFMDYNAFYTTNYEMIKYAHENGYKRYNFYGITGDFNEDNNEFFGLYSFKRGFGGEVTELIGEFDLIISKPRMIIYNFAKNIYSLLKKYRSRIKKG